MCFGKGIYQYHEEGMKQHVCRNYVKPEITWIFESCFELFLSDNKIVGDKISLGFFNNETNWSQEKEERVGSKTN